MRERFVELSSGRFHICEWGEPADPPLVLLHGFNQSAHSWREVGERATGRYVVAMTQRGHGDSHRAADRDYSRESMVADVRHLVDGLALRAPIDLVGMSMGAVHAICFAADHADTVRRLCVVDYAPETQREGIDKIIALLSVRWPSFDAAVAQVRKFNPRRSEDNIRQRLSNTIEEKPDGTWSWKVDMAFAEQGRFSAPASAMWDTAGRVGCPALVVRGGQSDVLAADKAERLRDTFAEGALVTIEGAGHSVPGDKPEAFSRVLLSFLS